MSRLPYPACRGVWIFWPTFPVNQAVWGEETIKIPAIIENIGGEMLERRFFSLMPVLYCTSESNSCGLLTSTPYWDNICHNNYLSTWSNVFSWSTNATKQVLVIFYFLIKCKSCVCSFFSETSLFFCNF